MTKPKHAGGSHRLRRILADAAANVRVHNFRGVGARRSDNNDVKLFAIRAQPTGRSGGRC
jgi:hypothetical protein